MEDESMHTKVVPQTVGTEGEEMCACFPCLSWTVR